MRVTTEGMQRETEEMLIATGVISGGTKEMQIIIEEMRKASE
jgi:hypothetical protein